VNRYLYLVKNLRAIYIPIDDKEQDNRVSKLLKKFYRYRIVGVPVWYCKGEQNICDTKPFYKLDEFDELERILDHLFRNEWLKNTVVSSYFVVPIVSGFKQLNNIIKCIEPVVEYRHSGDIEERDIKFNIRLGDYAMTDFLNDLISFTKEMLSEDMPFEQLAKLRADRMKDDFNKRYWRLIESNEKRGSEISLTILYIDVFKSLYDYGISIGIINKFPLLFNASIIILL